MTEAEAIAFLDGGETNQPAAAQPAAPQYQWQMPPAPEYQPSISERTVIPGAVPRTINRIADAAVNLPVRAGYALERLRRALPSIQNYFRTPEEKAAYQDLPTPRINLPQLPEGGVNVADVVGAVGSVGEPTRQAAYQWAIRPTLQAADESIGGVYSAVRALHPERVLAQDVSAMPKYQAADIPRDYRNWFQSNQAEPVVSSPPAQAVKVQVGSKQVQLRALPKSKSDLITDGVYQTARGPARWNGKQFVKE